MGTSEPLRAAVGGVCDAVLPQTCAACGVWVTGGGWPICDDCDAEVRAGLRRAYCPRCGRTLPRTAIHKGECARCRVEQYWNVAGVARVGMYTPAVRGLTVGLKYRGWERIAGYLGEVLATAIRACRWGESLDALVPVPMHRLRRWQRPCDHAQVLAEAVSQRLGVPVRRAVRRAIHGPSQTGLTTKNQRFDNVKGCFGPAWRWWRPDVAGQTVCIIDNLLATGATIYEVAKVLRRLKATRIYVAVVARPASPGDPVASAVEPEDVRLLEVEHASPSGVDPSLRSG